MQAVSFPSSLHILKLEFQNYLLEETELLARQRTSCKDLKSKVACLKTLIHIRISAIRKLPQHYLKKAQRGGICNRKVLIPNLVRQDLNNISWLVYPLDKNG